MVNSRMPIVLLLVALLIAGAVWLAMPRNDPALGVVDVAPNQRVDAPATPVTAPLEPNDRATRDAATPRGDTAAPNEAREAAPTAEQAALRVVLRGLHPKVPWTTPLRLEFVGLYDTNGAVHSDDVVPDADGRAQFVLPAWWTRCRHGRIGVKCDRYRASDHQWMGSIDPTTELVIDVQVVAELRGRVVDMRGKPVLAHVVAFPGGDTPKNGSAGMVGSNPEGLWSLPVPPDEPVLLVAQPMRRSFHVPLSWDEGLLDGRAPPPDPAASLLPGSRIASCPPGGITDVPDIVVPDAMLLHGLVRWNDGAPIEGAQLRLEPTGGEELALPDTSNVRRHPNGRFATTSVAATDATGAFTLPTLPGTEANVRLLTLPTLVLVKRDVTQPVRGSTIELRLPRPVAFRAVVNGTVERDATFEVETWWYPLRAEGDSLAIVPNGPFRIRARKETRCSPWLDCGPDAAGKTIDLALGEQLRAVTITFVGTLPELFVTLAWKRDDGREGRETVIRTPPDAPMQIFLEKGRYRLRLAEEGLGGQSLLFPAEMDVVVADAPVNLTFPLRAGGTFTVEATDGALGVHVVGTCRVLAATGEDVTAPFSVQQNFDVKRGAPGELLPGGPNRLARVLEPGEYELVFQFPDHGERRTKVSVRAGEFAEVRVRL